VLSWLLIEARTVLRRAGRAVDISVELAIDRGPYSVEADKEGVVGGRSADNGRRLGNPVYQQSRGLR